MVGIRTGAVRGDQENTVAWSSTSHSTAEAHMDIVGDHVGGVGRANAEIEFSSTTTGTTESST